MRYTTTVYYWSTEPTDSILTDIHDHERDGWHVHQIVPRDTVTVTAGASITVSDMFVVYAKDDNEGGTNDE